MAENDYVIGVDMGGTKVLAGVVNCGLEVMASHKVKTLAGEGPDRTLKQLKAAVRQAREGEHGDRRLVRQDLGRFFL